MDDSISETKKFEIVRTASGEISIRNNIVNEIMHNPVGPWAEANLLYIEASQLRTRLQTVSADPLVLYDVGLGAAANALAAMAAFEGVQQSGTCQRPLTIVSFENDLSLLKFVITHASDIPYIGAKKQVLQQLLVEKIWKSSDGQCCWHLHDGDFCETVTDEARSPDLVFYDPYSPKVNSEMWGTLAFTRLYAKTNNGQHPCSVYTYSRATPIRTAMLAAGFFVGMGPPSGLKDETTQAATSQQLLAHPLGERWLLRWLRSHTRFPATAAISDHQRITDAVLSHPQFCRHYQHTLLAFQRRC